MLNSNTVTTVFSSEYAAFTCWVIILSLFVGHVHESNTFLMFSNGDYLFLYFNSLCINTLDTVNCLKRRLAYITIRVTGFCYCCYTNSFVLFAVLVEVEAEQSFVFSAAFKGIRLKSDRCH
jgi:hypothetical protein